MFQSERMVRQLPFVRALPHTAAALALILGSASIASADSIQRAGLTAGIPEGYGRTPGFYVASMIDFGLRSSDPSITKQGVFAPVFFTWSTPWDVGKAHVSIKSLPFVVVLEHAPGLEATRPYNPYASVWFSWFLGTGWNVSIGEGAQLGFSNDLTKPIGRDFVAFQQNVAVSYFRNNWNMTANTFYTTGHTGDNGGPSQPHTMNVDFTAVRHVYRTDQGPIAYGVWDLNSPATGYLPNGAKQSEFAVGYLVGYLIGNLVQVNGKVTTDIYQNNYGGRDTRLTVMAVFPFWTPGAPKPRNGK